MIVLKSYVAKPFMHCTVPIGHKKGTISISGGEGKKWLNQNLTFLEQRLEDLEKQLFGAAEKDVLYPKVQTNTYTNCNSW